MHQTEIVLRLMASFTGKCSTVHHFRDGFVGYLLIAGLSLCLGGCSQTGYLLHLCKGQLEIICNTQPVEKVLADSEVPEAFRDKMQLIAEAKQFGETQLGLTPSKNYTTFYEVKNPPIAYNLVAAPQLALEPYRWCFPIVGCLPYKGFFDGDLARRERQRMIDKGYDTALRSVAAYSTLGWFTDPINSTMLAYPDIALVDVILHEMVHATIFLKGQGAFNEGIATFIGQTGAKAFFKTVKGVESTYFNDLKKRQEAKKRFQAMIKDLADRLQHLYASERTDEEKLEKRSEIFGDVKRTLESWNKDDGGGNKYKKLLNIEWNNALVVSYMTYHQDNSLWETVYNRFNGDLKAMAMWLKGFKGEKAPFERVNLWLEENEKR